MPHTAARVAALEAYFNHHVFDGTCCNCPSLRECRSSHRGDFYEAQLPHVGDHYDMLHDGRPLRVVVVGQEYGHGPSGVTLAARRAMIAVDSALRHCFKAEPGFPARNPHMKGCTNLLRLIFGLGLGTEHDAEFVEVAGERVHIFDCFALVNFLLCSAVPCASKPESERLAGKPGRSTRTMRANCAAHFRATLEILDPTLVVAQGKGVRLWIGEAFGIGPLPPAGLIEDMPLKRGTATLVSFSHPSAHGALNWGLNERMPYLLDVVAPAIKRAMSQ